ncbi:hypothetical protein [Streptomyces sp. NPDC088182]|uniref:hypothetical protein n=1 Tax=Streptomyces sp. NPDC088182 TaxID=3365838 RepID=UPI00382E2776
MTAGEDAVASLVNGGYPPGIAREIVAAVRGEARDEGWRAGMRHAADVFDSDDECRCGGCDSCLARQQATDLRRMAAGDPVAPVDAGTPAGVLITCGCNGDGIVRYRDENGAHVTLRCRTHGRKGGTS